MFGLRKLAGTSLAILIAGTSLALANDLIEIRIPQRTGSKSYIIPLLELALSKQERPYSITIPDGTRDLTQARVMAMLADPSDNVFNVYAAGLSDEFGDLVEPIKIPLMRGLLGVRVSAIPKGTQYKFDGVSSLRDLQKLTIIQGIGWGDVSILQLAGLTVETAQKHRIYKMIAAYRADMFPRGALEIIPERQQNSLLNYEIEEDLILLYDRFPFLFYTGKHDSDLANIISNGLETAYADGSFMEFFENHPIVVQAFRELDLERRRVIRIDNPSPVLETSEIPSRFWHKFGGR